MTEKQIRQSIALSSADWRELQRLAAQTNSRATRSAGKLPSWRVLLMRIARGEIKLEAPDGTP